MAQLDRLLSVMMSQRATALRLDEEERAELEIGGAPRPVTKTPLTGPQVVALLREIAPPDARASLDAGRPTEFSYTSDDGAFAVRTAREGTRWRARVTVDELGERDGRQSILRVETPGKPEAPVPPAPPPSTPTPSRGTSVGSPGDAISSFEGSERARAMLDALLRTTVQRGASDLHLRCGEPPLIRQHGEMTRMDQPALEPEEVEEMLRCIMTQRQVGVHTQSFKSALRAALREDPDIILVGELRDLETVSIAIETAETGHLVFGTLHTTTAASTIDRIIDQFPADRQAQIRVMLSESLKGVISQTLCKKIGGGRVAAREVLLSIPAITNLIREGKTFQIPSVMQTSKRLGMVTLNDALMDLVDSGQAEPAEAYQKCVEKTAFAAALKGRGIDTSFADAEAPKEKPAAPQPPARR